MKGLSIFKIGARIMKEKAIGIPELSRAKITMLTACFFLVFFISSDTLILSTASVSILSELGGQEHYSLIFSIRGIAIAVTCMLCGRLIDRMGRRNMLLFGLLTGLISNAIGAMSTSMLVLVISRAVYGLGYGFINAAVMIMINELFGKKSGYGYLITLVGYGVGNVSVPLLAGWLVEHYTWRWGFWMLVVSAVVCIILLVTSCPNYSVLEESANKKLDVKGVIYVTLAIIGLVGLLSFGGKSFPWLSLTTLVLVLFTVAMFILFTHTEKNIDQSIAIFPVSMMHSKILMGCAIGQFCMSVNSTCLYVYIPYYMQQEMGTTATQAGAATSIISFMTTVFGAFLLVVMVKAQRHSLFGLLTVIGEAVALILISVFISPALSVIAMYALVLFYGLTQSVESYAFTMTMQAEVPVQQIAIGTAFIQFVRQFTGVAATTIAAPILNMSPSFGTGMKNIFLFAAVITVLGAVVFAVLVPVKKKAEAA